MVVVMAAFGSGEAVYSPRQVWCLSKPDAGWVAERLLGEYAGNGAVDVIAVDFPEVGANAVRHPAWRRTADECLRLTLAMYCKSKQARQ